MPHDERFTEQWNERFTDWQPIETAPKDGTRVDLWCIPSFGHSGRVSDCWFSIGKWWMDDAFGNDCRSEVANAVHWMPVPEPPK
jgi:hypothetical protein